MFTIRCESCACSWQMMNGATVYEQQAIESRPCPGCGAYTLSCAQANQVVPSRLALSEKRRLRSATMMK